MQNVGTGQLYDQNNAMQQVISKPELCEYCFNEREIANVTDEGEVIMVRCPSCSPYPIQVVRQEIRARAALNQAVEAIEKFKRKRIDVRGLWGIFEGEKIS